MPVTATLPPSASRSSPGASEPVDACQLDDEVDEVDEDGVLVLDVEELGVLDAFDGLFVPEPLSLDDEVDDESLLGDEVVSLVEPPSLPEVDDDVRDGEPRLSVL